MKTLNGRVAVVAGASRGAGKGIALALGDAAATVYAVGRTTTAGAPPPDQAPGTVEETAAEVSRRGGRGIAVPMDATSDEQVADLFARVSRDERRIDIVANAVWGAADAAATMADWTAAWSTPFWEQPTAAWQRMMTAGPYSYYLMSTYALRHMAPARRGLIVGVTDGYVESPAGQAGDPMAGGPLLWQLAHQTINLLMQGIASAAKKHRVAAVTLMPGFMRTERVVRLVTTDALKKQFGFDKSESTEYVGRAVAALACDGNVLRQSGRIRFVADLAREYGFTDIDGRQVPRFAPY
jgi:NAD(P)-dependent dehydrogenase (short-subunit alcohol dehydrogenase family)